MSEGTDESQCGATMIPASKEREHRPALITLSTPQTSVEVMFAVTVKDLYLRIKPLGSGITPARPPGASGVSDAHRSAGPSAATPGFLGVRTIAPGRKIYRHSHEPFCFGCHAVG